MTVRRTHHRRIRGIAGAIGTVITLSGCTPVLATIDRHRQNDVQTGGILFPPLQAAARLGESGLSAAQDAVAPPSPPAGAQP